MKIDVHNHLGVDPAYEEHRTAKELVEEMGKAGIDKCVVFPFTTNPDFREQNNVVKEAVDEYRDRLIGFFTMNPRLPEMTTLMYGYMEQGFRGVVTDPRFGVGHEAKRFHELVECALVLEMPVWLHSDGDTGAFVLMAIEEMTLNNYVIVTGEAPYDHHHGLYKPDLLNWDLYTGNQQGVVLFENIIDFVTQP